MSLMEHLLNAFDPFPVFGIINQTIKPLMRALAKVRTESALDACVNIPSLTISPFPQPFQFSFFVWLVPV